MPTRTAPAITKERTCEIAMTTDPQSRAVHRTRRSLRLNDDSEHHSLR
jgi:hypothetical protein